MHTENNETMRPYLRPLFGNVVEILRMTDKVTVIKFAVDNYLGYFDKTERKTKYKTKFFETKFFFDALSQFSSEKIKKGDRLEMVDYSFIWEERYDKNTGKTREVCDLGVKKFTHHARNRASDTPDEPSVSNIILTKPIISKNKEDVSSGNSSWMTE
jgi:hypothetical protein